VLHFLQQGGLYELSDLMPRLFESSWRRGDSNFPGLQCDPTREEFRLVEHSATASASDRIVAIHPAQWNFPLFDS
jgi:hypothetical protein